MRAHQDDPAGRGRSRPWRRLVCFRAGCRRWPGFRDTATRCGLVTSLSIPLFAGSGATIASLNLYSRRAGALTASTTSVSAVFDPGSTGRWDHDALEAGGRELTTGLIGAVALRALIQRAVASCPPAGRTPAAATRSCVNEPQRPACP